MIFENCINIFDELSIFFH